MFVLPVHRGGQLVLLLPWVLGRPEDSRKWSWEALTQGVVMLKIAAIDIGKEIT